MKTPRFIAAIVLCVILVGEFYVWKNVDPPIPTYEEVAKDLHAEEVNIANTITVGNAQLAIIDRKQKEWDKTFHYVLGGTLIVGLILTFSLPSSTSRKEK